MKRPAVVLVLTMLAAGVLRADERIVSETFASSGTLLFRLDNVTQGSLESDNAASAPYDQFLRMAAGATVESSAFNIGPADRGGLEDVVWMRLSPLEEDYPGRRRGFTVVAFDSGGPELRVIRTTSRPEATLQWFDGTGWKSTGATLTLDRSWRLRTVMDLDSGTMDVYLRGGPAGNELAVAVGVTFRPFMGPTPTRRFALGRPAEMTVEVAAWQLWRVGRSELLRLSVLEGDGPSGPAQVRMRYAASAALSADAVESRTATGGVTYSLRSVRGMVDDMELADISKWRPADRVQRQTSFRHSGQWSLGLSEGSQPVDTEVLLPRGDVDIRMYFLVPKEIPANRQVYLVRFKNPETGTEPVGPSVYLDYGAAPEGKSLIIAQLRHDRYYSEEVTVEPEKWYGLHVVVHRALDAYTLGFIDETGVEKPVNEGKPLSFFLSSGIGEQVLWRFFSIISMRPTVTDWPKIDLKVRHRRLPVTIPEKDRKQLGGLTLRGLPAERAKDVDVSDAGKVMSALSNYGVVIERNWPDYKVDRADAEKVKGYRALIIEGNMYFPWSGIEFAYSSAGPTWMWPQWQSSVPGVPTAEGEFRKWEMAGERPSPIPEGVSGVRLLILPDAKGEFRTELRWVQPSGAYDKPQPIPPALFHGEDVLLWHPGASIPARTAAVLDGRLYVGVEPVGLAVYDPELLRTSYHPFFFEKVIGNRYSNVTGFVWDPWAKCFWVFSPGTRYVCALGRNLDAVTSKTYLYAEYAGMTAGPDSLYFIGDKGEVHRYNKFLSVRSEIPMEKMFGGVPLFSAAACVDHFLYLATRKDSPVYPEHVICIDTTTWHPVFSVEVKDRFPEVTAMTTDGETMFLLSRNRPEVGTFRLPPRHELAPQKTFIYVDDLSVTDHRSVEDIRLLPDASGGVSGWSPAGALVPNEKGEGWSVARPTQATYEKQSIVYVREGESEYGYLKVQTVDPSGELAVQMVDLRTAQSDVVRRVAIVYVGNQRVIKQNPELYGRNYTLEEFFAQREFSPWHNRFTQWSRFLEGPRRGVDLRVVRMLPAGMGYRDHVFSLEKDFGLKVGETVNGIILPDSGFRLPIVSVTLSPSPWTPRDESAGSVTSHPVLLDEGTRRLEWVWWDQTPFDPERGRLTVSVRTDDEKYFIDRKAWTPVVSRTPCALPVGRYLQWRLEMSTKDPWRPPGISRLVLGLSANEASAKESQAAHPHWLWLVFGVPAAAAALYLLIGRRSLWERKKKPA